MHVDDEDVRKLAAALTHTVTPLLKGVRTLGEALNCGMQEFWAGPNGRFLRAAMIRAQQAEVVLVSCDCLCRRWGHGGACTGWATAQRSAGPPHDVVLQVCGPCAAGIDAHRLTSPAR